MQVLLAVPDGALGVDDLVDLLVGGLGDARVAVTEVGDADAAGEVEELAPLVIPNPAARALLEDVGRQTGDAASNMLGAKGGEVGRGRGSGCRG